MVINIKNVAIPVGYRVLLPDEILTVEDLYFLPPSQAFIPVDSYFFGTKAVWYLLAIRKEEEW